jgi:putative DNA primase/helicase
MSSTPNALEKFDQLMLTQESVMPDGLEVICARDIKAEPISWLWKDWLARGMVHLLAGMPGQGKTTIAMSLCSTVSGGGHWPDGTSAEAGDVLIWSGEDDLSNVLKPRLMASGHLDRCHFITGTRQDGELRSFDPAKDLSEVEKCVQRIGDVRLLVLDPIVTVVLGDSHNNNDVRRGLQPLVDFAMRWNVAILGLTHLSKGSAGTEPALRVIGSVGFIAVARAVFLAQKLRQSDGTERGIFVKAKANAAASNGGFAYEIEQVNLDEKIETTRIRWGEALEGSALELLSESKESGREQSDLIESLRLKLEGGPVLSDEVMKSMKELGYSEGQVKRASIKLGVNKNKQGMLGPWVWSLSPPSESD